MSKEEAKNFGQKILGTKRPAAVEKNSRSGCSRLLPSRSCAALAYIVRDRVRRRDRLDESEHACVPHKQQNNKLQAGGRRVVEAAR